MSCLPISKLSSILSSPVSICNWLKRRSFQLLHRANSLVFFQCSHHLIVPFHLFPPQFFIGSFQLLQSVKSVFFAIFDSLVLKFPDFLMISSFHIGALSYKLIIKPLQSLSPSLGKHFALLWSLDAFFQHIPHASFSDSESEDQTYPKQTIHLIGPPSQHTSCPSPSSPPPSPHWFSFSHSSLLLPIASFPVHSSLSASVTLLSIPYNPKYLITSPPFSLTLLSWSSPLVVFELLLSLYSPVFHNILFAPFALKHSLETISFIQLTLLFVSPLPLVFRPLFSQSFLFFVHLPLGSILKLSSFTN